ncbi:polysaccharide lyase [Oleiharenicola lentus]|uniref:Polysaccharide lyase n=1 Tax=Oleiharenicola lentus TaxID=2508720 RepID=A0A4Q1C5B6_9BACT|nr:polysaccharide lyase [Oleiharenicola lentus]RXK53628.1 polysaccharide lyase [Oleiharenicola lentus]
MRSLRPTLVLSLAFTLAVSAFAQGYPKVPPDLQAAMNARKAAADRRSDEIFASHQAELAAWAAQGKPYLPGAAKPADLPQASIPAFPGAWGGGMYSFGGRGGKIYVVTNLNDSGPGSFREACEAAGPRTVVFNVAGVIHLKERIRIRAPYITISGATAPGDGICFAGKTVEVETHDVVIRHLRFRRGNTDPADRDDSLGGNPVGNVIVDHVSTSWSLDENISMYRHMFDHDGDPRTPARKLPTVNITIQHSISSESLSTYHHAFGSTIGGHNSTFHHNLWASNTGRNPSVGMDGDFTFVNNVLFNWRHRTVDGGDHRSRYNIINNYFKPGPGTPDNDVRYRLLKPESERSQTVVNNFGRAFVAGNVVEGNERVTRDNWDGGVQPDVATREEKLRDLLPFAPKDEAKRADYLEKSRAKVAALKFLTEDPAEALAAIRVNEPFPHALLPVVSASEAYAYVLANAGATLPRRDSVDQRIIESVRTGVIPPRTVDAGTAEKARFYGYEEKWVKALSEYVTKGYVTHPNEVGGWPDYQGTPYVDSDGDGLPDTWESAHGLNPQDPADASADLNGDGYTNIEDFLNGLDPRAPKTDWTDLKNNRDPRHTM